MNPFQSRGRSYYPGQKKKEPFPRFVVRRTLFHHLIPCSMTHDQRRAKVADDLALIARYHKIEQCSSHRKSRGWFFFFLSRVVRALWPSLPSEALEARPASVTVYTSFVLKEQSHPVPLSCTRSLFQLGCYKSHDHANQKKKKKKTPSKQVHHDTHTLLVCLWIPFFVVVTKQLWCLKKKKLLDVDEFSFWTKQGVPTQMAAFTLMRPWTTEWINLLFWCVWVCACVRAWQEHVRDRQGEREREACKMARKDKVSKEQWK